MNILYDSNGVIEYIASRIEYGVFDDSGISKWGFYDSDDNLGNLFFMDAGYETATISEDDIPSDYNPADYKYLFIDGEFVINPDWQPPEEPVEVRINRLEEALAELAEMMFGGKE